MMGLPMIAAIPTNVMTKPASIALRLCPRIISALAQNVNPHVPQKAAKPVSPSKPHVATYTKAAGSDSLRRKPRVRLYRREISGLAECVYRSAQQTVRRDAASTRHYLPAMKDLANAIV